MNSSINYGVIFCLSFFVFGCTTLPKQSDGLVNQLDGPLAQLQVDTKQLYQRMQRLTVEKGCSIDQECKVLPIGRRACGGPEQYLVYSVLHTDEKLLAITNDRHTKLKQKQQERLGLVSTCVQLPAATAACASKQCVLVQ